MREKDLQLAKQCQDWAEAALKAEAWIKDNADSVGGECDVLRKYMRQSARSFRRLSRAAQRKMCIGVFGPSQSGKSYLISALARDSNGELMADFAGRAVDFIREINPEGNKESTGLVTRFTTTPPVGITKERPIRLRLFSETDLVRIFANTYYADCDHKDIPNQEELLEKLREVEKEAVNVNTLITRDDIEDLREYLNKNFASRSRIQLLQRAFWNKAADLIGKLDLAGRAKLFGIIWNNVPEFNAYFLELAQVLENLGNPDEANCPLEAIIPRNISIIDVELLKHSSKGADEYLELEGVGGKVASLPRCVITALTAEITIYMPVSPADFFAYTDLLDFPGYRSRLKTADLASSLAKSNALETFFLRGKVAYLFERYCDEQELTGMLLCIGPGNQDVLDLPGTINHWIALTQGEEPKDRRGKEPTLFFILTKVDTEFERKLGVTDVSNRWNNRIAASLTSFFGAQYSWPENWDGQPFRNMFLLRNPNIRCDAVFDFDDNGKEIGIRQDMADHVEQVRQSFLHTEAINKHFPSPLESWNAAMKLNDGGIALLRLKLAPICDPDRKFNQTRDRASELAARVVKRLSPYYKAGDLDKLIKQKSELAVTLMRNLVQLVSKQQFADFLRRFQIEDYSLYELATECYEIAELSDEQTDAGQQDIVGSKPNVDKMMEDLFGGLDLPSAPVASEEPEEKQDEMHDTDQVDAFCRKAINYWVEHVHTVAENQVIARVYGIPNDTIEKIVSELVLSSRQVHLMTEMAASIRKKTAFRNLAHDRLAWPMASEAAYRINSFVSWLGHDPRLEQKTEIIYNGTPTELFKPPVLSFGPNGEPIVPEQQEQYDRTWCTDWLKAFYERIVANATIQEDDFDPAQNKRLGEILDTLSLSEGVSLEKNV